MRKRLATLVFLALPVFAASCGEEASGPLEIVRAEWVSGEGEARAVVSGTWVRGLSTPPSCRLTEGRDGETSEWPDSGSNTTPDGNAFTKEFTSGGASLDPLPEYHVRCSVFLSTGRTYEAIAPVSGETPRG